MKTRQQEEPPLVARTREPASWHAFGKDRRLATPLQCLARLSRTLLRFPRRQAPLLFAGALVLSSSIAPAVAQAPGARILAITVVGNAHVSTEEILSQMSLHPGMSFDPQRLRQDLRRVFALGLFADQVPPTIRHRPGGVTITLNVIENPVIKHLRFVGAHEVMPETLAALMDTETGQVLNTNTFHDDVLKINVYYDKIGYGGQVPTHVPDLSIDPQTGTLTLRIIEGLTIRHVIFAQRPEADPVMTAAQLSATVSVHAGDVFSEATRDKDEERVKDLYQRNDLQLGDFAAGIVPGSVDTKTETADLEYRISAARVAAVQITGNAKTRDAVIRRQLHLHAGDLITQSGLRRDYERVNNLGFFDRVDLVPKPGPDPSRPADVTLDWNVKEGRTGTATIGAGYSGGLTGQGLTGNIGYSENNVNGTGNGASVRFQRGSLVSDLDLSATIPYLGNTPRSERYSLSGTLYLDSQQNYYPIYPYSPTGVASSYQPQPSGITGPAGSINSIVPSSVQSVQLIPNGVALPGVVATYASRNNGVSATLGRRLSDYVTASAGINLSRIATDVTVPAGYSFAQTNGGIATSASGAEALGITAPSIADFGNGGANLRSVSLGLGDDTRDDYFNPRRGYRAQLGNEISMPGLGSDFHFNILTFDGAHFSPIGRTATLGLHVFYGTARGAIPASKLFTFSDQQLRGYNDVFYGTDAILLQSELRVPLTADKHFGLAVFGETGGTRIRGASSALDPSGYYVNYGSYTFHGDVGAGLRFDIPQLGFRSIRLDVAKGSRGHHVSFGIGQSF